MTPENRPHSPLVQPENPQLQALLESRRINPKTYEFLQTCLTYGVHEILTVRQRNIIGVYYGTSSSLRDLQALTETTNQQTASNQILTGLGKMWQQLSPKVQTQFPIDETLLLKNKGRTLSEEARRKIGEAHKGKTLSEETRRKIGEAYRERNRRLFTLQTGIKFDD